MEASGYNSLHVGRARRVEQQLGTRRVYGFVSKTQQACCCADKPTKAEKLLDVGDSSAGPSSSLFVRSPANS